MQVSESVDSLKEKLSGQNLILSKVDVSVVSPQKQAGSEFLFDQGSNLNSDWNETESNQQQSRKDEPWNQFEDRISYSDSPILNAQSSHSLAKPRQTEGRINIVA